MGAYRERDYQAKDKESAESGMILPCLRGKLAQNIYIRQGHSVTLMDQDRNEITL